MKRIYQRIISPTKGDCFKCCICSLLELDYEDVPNFIELGDNWWLEAYKLFEKFGYELGSCTLMNPNVRYLENPTGFIKKELCDIEVPDSLFLPSIKKEDGIDGLFLASVYSPKYSNPNEHPIAHLHSVICDINFNVVHDPQPEYKDIANYPYAQIIGFNGIRAIDTIRRIE